MMTMEEEHPIDLLIEAQEDTNKILRQIVAQLGKAPNLSSLEDAIDDQTEVLKEMVRLEAEPEEPEAPEEPPVIQVTVPPISVPFPVVTVMPSQERETIVVTRNPRKYISTITRDSFGYIYSIETVVIE